MKITYPSLSLSQERQIMSIPGCWSDGGNIMTDKRKQIFMCFFLLQKDYEYKNLNKTFNSWWDYVILPNCRFIQKSEGDFIVE